MPSSKGKPTDPKLREEVKEDVKNETNTDGGGKGQWSAWKAAKLSKEYEKKGGGYENEPGSKNEPKKGAPEPKAEGEKEAEVKKDESKKTESKKGSGKSAATTKANGEKKKTAKPKREKAPPREGTRRSARVGSKRDADGEAITSNGKKQKTSKA